MKELSGKGWLTISTNHSGYGDEVLSRNQPEVEDEEGCGDHPVNVPRVEKLPAPRDRRPALARKHSKVRERRDTADEGINEIVLPALGIRVCRLQMRQSVT